MRRIETILILVCICFGSGLSGQDNYMDHELQPAQIDEEQWTKTLDERDYYEKSEPSKKGDTPELPDFDISQLGWLVYVMIGLLITLLIFLLVKVIGAKQNIKVREDTLTYQDLESIEDDLGNADLNAYMQRALEEKDYRLAMRVLYLMTLKEMQEQNWLTYRKDKTNFNYIMELNPGPQRKEFTRLTKAFEHIWYGELEFNQEQFELIKVPFNRFIDSVRPNEQR